VPPESRDLNVGERIEALRTRRELSREALAERIGTTAGALAAVEAGEASPNIATLVRIAGALGVTLSHFFRAPGPERNVEVVRREDRPQHPPHGRHASYSYEALTHNVHGRHMQPFLVEFPRPGEVAAPELVTHKGEEFLYILSGEVDFRHGDGPVITLREGDSLYFDSGVPHALEGRGPDPARALAVIYSPED
jgi:transcriptional regulator with XRE-family HTH domain